MPTLARGRLAAARRGSRSGSSCRRRSARPGRRARRARLAASAPSSRVRPGTSIRAPSIFSTKRPARSGVVKEKRRVARVARVADGRVALDPLDLLDPRLRLAAPSSPCSGSARRSAPSARSPPAGARSPCRARSRAPPAPRARRARGRRRSGPPRLELEHRGADRLEEPAVVGDEDDGGVEAGQVALEPLQRGDVEVVGRLVEQQQVRAGGERAGQRGAGQLAAGEGRQRPLGLLGGRSRGRASTASTSSRQR